MPFGRLRNVIKVFLDGARPRIEHHFEMDYTKLLF